jgi:GDPmannose 4,6-dehydratase
LYLGNLDAKRDWGHAKDYVEAMWLMLQQETPDDYVIATGETHTIRDLLDVAFGHFGLDWHSYVSVDPKYYRPTEVDILQGDASKAKRVLGWEPKIRFKELIKEMVDSDFCEVQNELRA